MLFSIVRIMQKTLNYYYHICFGYAKGAFTGADKEKKGLIDEANNGILFLDEVHRLPPEGKKCYFH